VLISSLELDSIQKKGSSSHGPMSSQPPQPLCPQCGRRIAAWKREHCVYCGAAFPPGFKDGLAEPEGLKWVERPAIPPEAARKLEMMKVVPLEGRATRRSLPVWIGLVSLPIFAVVFFLLYSLLRRYMPGAAGLLLFVEAAILAYLGWTFYRASRP
jgi:hypothetical protein